MRTSRMPSQEKRVETLVALAPRESAKSIAVDRLQRSDVLFFRCPWLEMGVLGELYALLDSSQRMGAWWNDFVLVCAQQRPSNVLAFEFPSRLCALLRDLTPERIDSLGESWVSSRAGIKRARSAAFARKVLASLVELAHEARRRDACVMLIRRVRG